MLVLGLVGQGLGLVILGLGLASHGLGLGLEHQGFDFASTRFMFLFETDMNELSILSILQYSIFWYE